MRKWVSDDFFGFFQLSEGYKFFQAEKMAEGCLNRNRTQTSFRLLATCSSPVKRAAGLDNLPSKIYCFHYFFWKRTFLWVGTILFELWEKRVERSVFLRQTIPIWDDLTLTCSAELAPRITPSFSVKTEWCWTHLKAISVKRRLCCFCWREGQGTKGFKHSVYEQGELEKEYDP